jgi:hypothetical protein
MRPDEAKALIHRGQARWNPKVGWEVLPEPAGGRAWGPADEGDAKALTAVVLSAFQGPMDVLKVSELIQKIVEEWAIGGETPPTPATCDGMALSLVKAYERGELSS